MSVLVDRIFNETILHRNWNFYRDNYIAGNLSHEELSELNDRWYDVIKEQVFFNEKWAVDFFKSIDENVKVVELGCYRGELANKIISQFDNIIYWDGFDICKKAIIDSVTSSSKYLGRYLLSEFWKFDLLHYDVFVSTHTIEHFTKEEALLIFEAIHKSVSIKHIYLEMPINENGKVWRGGASSHVLTMGRKHVRSWFVDRNWKIMNESTVGGMNWSISIRREND